MNKALPFVVGLIIGFVVMFVVQLLRKKRVPGALTEFSDFRILPTRVFF